MPKDPQKPVNKPAADRTKAPVASFKLAAASARPITVEHQRVPPPRPERKRIHARRLLRRVPEGRERDFHSQTREIGYHLQFALPMGPRTTTDDIVLTTNSELTQPGSQQLASSVGEPSVAVKDKVVMYTGNWYAARSIDGGASFEYIDPFTAFPDPQGLGMCCDQVVNYIASIDTFVWLLQYGPKTGPDIDNLQRLAFAKTADVAAGRWRQAIARSTRAPAAQRGHGLRRGRHATHALVRLHTAVAALAAEATARAAALRRRR